LAKACAVARPMPLDAPVMTTTGAWFGVGIGIPLGEVAAVPGAGRIGGRT
jgi:hypothetical protein